MSGLFERMSDLGPVFAAHILLCAAALALGIAVALPLAVWASRSRKVARIALGFASLVQTVPALALLALFFPILLSLRAVFGEGLPTLGFLPALLALALYALLPILRNAVTAQANLDPAVIEAADGMGMTGGQRLRLVEAPLAAPYIMAGIRTAAVWTIGAATLATTIGQPSLGDPIFAGLQTQNWELVLAGCLASAGLALGADGLLALAERGLATRRKGLWVAALGLVAASVAAAGFASLDDSEDSRIVIGAKSFSEQYILTRLIGSRLEVEGYEVEYRDGLGSAVAHGAVASGSIDILVDYTGTIWTNQMKREDTPDRDTMLSEIEDWERDTHDIRVLGRLGFENAYGLAMQREQAEALGIASIADLAARAPSLVVGGDPEFFERPEWEAVAGAYGLRFAEYRNFAPTFMYNALVSGEADVIGAYTSDGRIEAEDLVVLDDPRGAFPNYDAIILLSESVAQDDLIVGQLDDLVNAIDVKTMRSANLMVDRTDADKRTPEQAANWLARELFGS